MKNRGSLLWIATVGTFLRLIGAPAGNSAIAQNSVTEPRAGWRETYQERVPASGYVRVGVMQLSGATGFDPQHLIVALPPSELPRLCLSVTSVDGRYGAELEYDVATLARGRRLLHLPSKYIDQLRRYGPDSLALLAQLNERCDAPSKYFIVATWASSDPATPVTVFLNSSVAATVIDKADPGREFQCRPNTGAAAAVAFNLRCDIALAALARRNEFIVARSRRPGVAMPPVALPVLWP